MKKKEERIKFKESLNKKRTALGYKIHSSFLAYSKNTLKYEVLRDVCYADLLYYGQYLDEIYIFFSDEDINCNPESWIWVDWLINESILKEAFITKNIMEGFNYGFEINCNENASIVKHALIALRHPFEFRSNWQWFTYIKLGFNEIESWYLANCYHIENGRIYKDLVNKGGGHLTFDKNQSLKCLSLKNLNLHDDSFKNLSKSLSLYSFRYKYIDNKIETIFNLKGNLPYGEHHSVKLNKTNLKKILKHSRS